MLRQHCFSVFSSNKNSNKYMRKGYTVNTTYAYRSVIVEGTGKLFSLCCGGSGERGTDGINGHGSLAILPADLGFLLVVFSFVSGKLYCCGNRHVFLMLLSLLVAPVGIFQLVLG